MVCLGVSWCVLVCLGVVRVVSIVCLGVVRVVSIVCLGVSWCGECS